MSHSEILDVAYSYFPTTIKDACQGRGFAQNNSHGIKSSIGFCA
jgi:hypothetical protein